MPTKSASKTIIRENGWLGPAVTPGEILFEEYLKPLGLGQVEAAWRLGVSLNGLHHHDELPRASSTSWPTPRGIPRSAVQHGRRRGDERRKLRP